MEAVFIKNDIESVIFESLSGLIDVKKESFITSEPLKNYGLDSMDGLQLLYDVGEKLNISKRIEVKNLQEASFDYIVCLVQNELAQKSS